MTVTRPPLYAPRSSATQPRNTPNGQAPHAPRGYKNYQEHILKEIQDCVNDNNWLRGQIATELYRNEVLKSRSRSSSPATRTGLNGWSRNGSQTRSSSVTANGANGWSRNGSYVRSSSAGSLNGASDYRGQRYYSANDMDGERALRLRESLERQRRAQAHRQVEEEKKRLARERALWEREKAVEQRERSIQMSQVTSQSYTHFEDPYVKLRPDTFSLVVKSVRDMHTMRPDALPRVKISFDDGPCVHVVSAKSVLGHSAKWSNEAQLHDCKIPIPIAADFLTIVVEDAKHSNEFLGRVALPLDDRLNGDKWCWLKDRPGNTQDELKLRHTGAKSFGQIQFHGRYKSDDEAAQSARSPKLSNRNLEQQQRVGLSLGKGKGKEKKHVAINQVEQVKELKRDDDDLSSLASFTFGKAAPNKGSLRHGSFSSEVSVDHKASVARSTVARDRQRRASIDRKNSLSWADRSMVWVPATGTEMEFLVVEANGLQAGPGDEHQYFTTVYFMDGDHKTTLGSTDPHDGYLDSPRWEEKFAFRMPSSNVHCMCVDVFDLHTDEKEGYLGTAQCRLDSKSNTSYWVDVLRDNDLVGRVKYKILTMDGTHFVQKHSKMVAGDSDLIGYEPAHHQKLKKNIAGESAEPGALGHLDVTIHNASNLVNTDSMSKSDPYVQMFWGYGDTPIGQTKVIKDSLNPTWEQSFSFQIPSNVDTLTFVAEDKDDMTADDFLGIASVIFTETQGKITLPLEPRAHHESDIKLMKKNGGSLGHLTVSIDYKAPLKKGMTKFKIREINF